MNDILNKRLEQFVREAKAIIAAGGDIHYVGASGPQDFDENGDVAGYFSANVVKDGAWEGTIIE